MRKLFACIAVLCVAACSQSAPPPARSLDFSQLPPLRFNVAQIRVDQNYQSPGAYPNVEQEFVTPPAKAVAQWVADRLQAAGSSGLLMVSVDHASVVATKLPEKTGIEGWFAEPQRQYNATLNVTIQLFDGVNPMSLAEANVKVTREQSLNEDASDAERAQLYASLTRALMQSFDTEATAQIRQYFSTYLR